MNDKENSILRNKYNRLMASHSDLSQQLEDKAEQLRELERVTKITTGNARSLCKEILAKDPNEMVLGRSYSWSNVEINSLIEKSIQVFRSYNTDRTNLMRRLYAQNEDLSLQVESLKAQIETMQHLAKSQGTAHEPVTDDTGEIQDIPPWETPSTKDSEVIKKTPYKMQKAMEAGKIEAIIEEDSDIVSKDIVDMQEAMSLADALSAKMKDIPVHPAKKRMEKKQEHQQKRNEAYMIDLSETKGQMTEVEWALLDAIGTFGLSQYPQIESKAQDIWQKRGSPQQEKLSSSRIRIGLQKLINLQAIQQELVSTPFVSKFSIYSLSPMGTHIYKGEKKKEPVLSERDQIVAEHDNIEHGYGIKAVHEMLVESGYFKTVSCSMKNNRIPLDNGLQYIPDIIAVGDRYKSYYEYERGTHIQKNFSAKLNKACKVTNVVHIVTPNRHILEKVVKQVAEWIKSRGGHKALTGKKVRLATAQHIRGKNPQYDDAWNYIFDMKSDIPKENTADEADTIEAVPPAEQKPDSELQRSENKPQNRNRQNRPPRSGSSPKTGDTTAKQTGA